VHRFTAPIARALPQTTITIPCAGKGRWLSIQKLSKSGDPDSHVLSIHEVQVRRGRLVQGTA
jgi:hypothetical protein